MLTDTALRNFKPKPKTCKASDRDGGAKVFFLSASWALQGLENAPNWFKIIFEQYSCFLIVLKCL